MCRLLLYLGKPIVLYKLLVEPENSLINQSIHARSIDTPVNGDGFGVAWYVPEITSKPGLFRSLLPAWSNNNLERLSRVTRSGTVLAHVRAASSGIESAESNCHPFTYMQFAFAHNGDVGCFKHIRRHIEAELSQQAYDLINGNTDSEHVFALFIDQIRALQAADTSTNAGVDSALFAKALEQTVAKVLALARIACDQGHEDVNSYLNITITDGVRGVACRCSTDTDENTPTLYVFRRGEYSCEDGVCSLDVMRPGDGAVVVSSEALTQDSAWEIVPHNHMVIIAQDRTVTIRPMNLEQPD